MTQLFRFICGFLLLSPAGCGSNDKSGDADGGDASTIDVQDQEIDASNPVFSASELPSFYLDLSERSVEALEQDPFVYQEGTFRYVSQDGSEEITLEGVGIRLKGRASFRPIGEKAAFKVKFNEFVPGQRFLGLRRLTLNNMVQDPSMMRERLGYLFFRVLGAPVSRCNHARVYLNDTYYGLYANVESLDKSFLERNFAPPDGNLFDTSNEEYFVDMVPGNEPLFELETNRETNDVSDLYHLIDVLDGPEESFVEDAESVIDLDQFLRLGAAQAVIADWDGYFGASNNYKIYHEVAADRFVLFPWGIDQTFNIMDRDYTMLDYRIDGSSSDRPNGVVLTKCRADEGCYRRYLAYVEAAVETFEALRLTDKLDQMLRQIEAARKDDTFRPYSDSEVDRSVDRLREFLEQRGAIVRDQLEYTSAPSTPEWRVHFLIPPLKRGFGRYRQ